MAHPNRAQLIHDRQPPPQRRRSDTIVPVPHYTLYGETAKVDWFVHVEQIGRRAQGIERHIAPHLHPRFTQLVFVSSGGGEMSLDGDVYPFSGPCLLIVPPFRIHGFDYDAATKGRVVTIENNHLNDILDRAPLLRTVLEGACMLPLSGKAHDALASNLADLEDELAGHSEGSMIGVDLQVMNMLLTVLRNRAAGATAWQPAKAELVSQFINLVEESYREQPNIDDMARTLCVSAAQLRSACKAKTGLLPLEILHDRIAAEAKRCLAYTNASVTEISYALGFDDVAYFSRFFSRTLGIAPTKFRDLR